MTKKYYTAPEAERLEAVNASSFLADSPNGEIPDLQDSGLEIEW